MARPENIKDLPEQDLVEFATVEVGKLAADGAWLRVYADLMVAVQELGGAVEIDDYRNKATLSRPPTERDLQAQLKEAQNEWDDGQKFYAQLRELGAVEYSYQRTRAEEWARQECLPFPPEHEPIEPVDAVIREIDELADSGVTS